MESPPLASHTPKNPNKRVISGSSSSYMDQDVVEIPPPESWRSGSKSLEQKGVICYEVFDSDQDEDDVIIIGEKGCKNKGKAVVHVSDGPSSNKSKKGLTDQSVAPTSATSHSSNLNSFSSNFLFNDLMDVDEYAMVQALFESSDIPAGIEASIPWWPDSSLSKKPELEFMSPSYPEASQIKKKLSSMSGSIYSRSQAQNNGLNAFGGQPSTWGSFNPTPSALNGTSSSVYLSFDPQLNKIDIRTGSKPSRSMGSSNFPSAINGTSGSVYPSFDPQLNKVDIRIGSKSSRSAGSSSFNKQPSSTYDLLNNINTPLILDPARCEKNEDSGESSTSRVMDENENDEVLKKLKLFKKFDMVDDHLDHHYGSQGSFAKQPPKNWAKKIQEEWKILENDLPDTIFVRVYESRMDLLRAVIVGAEGTPYHDSLFFFDISFPISYPCVPPLVHYHSHGLRLNPNLYNCGKVCLSLLNTWGGSSNEMWIPGKSTMLQVLVSIQALVLNADPYFNEPGWASSRGTPHGSAASANYNESTLLLSLRSMLYTLNKPPKHFEELVKGHFYKHAHIILRSCKAYIEGAQVGSLVKGAGKNVEVSSKDSSSNKGIHNNYIIKPPGMGVSFKDNVAALVNQLVPAFTNTGAKDCEKFSSPTGAQGSNQASTMLNVDYYGGSNLAYVMPFTGYNYWI